MMDLTEAEDIKKRWQEYTELCKKYLNDQGNHYGVITHLKPGILECEVKLALGSITMNKARGGDGIPVEQFQILKGDAVKVLHSICQQIWKISSGYRTGKVQFSSQSQRKECQKMFKLLHNCTHLNASKIILKILQTRLQQNVNCELSDVQVGFRKVRGTRDQIANICWIME